MANLLIVDTNGRRRVAIEVAASEAGHRSYSAGSVVEAERMAAVYVPDVVIALLGDQSNTDLVRKLRESENPLIKAVPIVTDKAMNGASDITITKNDPNSIISAIDQLSTPNGV